MIIRKAKLDDLERITEFNIQMAKETEGKIIEKKIAREGAKAVLIDELKGFYLVAEENKG